jgi:hypothetical protein
MVFQICLAQIVVNGNITQYIAIASMYKSLNLLKHFKFNFIDSIA